MAKKGATHATPSKQFRVPADMAPLANYATQLVNAMRATFTWRMNEGQRSIGSGRGAPSKRGKPGRKKG